MGFLENMCSSMFGAYGKGEEVFVNASALGDERDGVGVGRVGGADRTSADLSEAKGRLLFHDDLCEHGGGAWVLAKADITCALGIGWKGRSQRNSSRLLSASATSS